jgi:hypothetical protein
VQWGQVNLALKEGLIAISCRKLPRDAGDTAEAQLQVDESAGSQLR